MTSSPSGSAALVSIVVPVYNCESYLAACLESLAGQCYPHLEIVLVNDGSGDGSPALCRAFVAADPRARLIETANRGPAAARNVGIAAAGGAHLLFVDADDRLPPDAVTTLVAAQQTSNADLVIGDFAKLVNGSVVASGHDRYFAASRTLDRDGIRDYVLAYLGKPNRFPLFVYSWGRLYRMSIVREHALRFDEELRTFEDVAFNFAYLQHTATLHFLDQIVYSHLVHDNYASASMTAGSRPINLFGYRQALAIAREYLAQAAPDVDAERRVGHAYVCYTIIQCVRLCGQLNAANEQVVTAAVREVVGDDRLAASLPHYLPTPGDSRILPWLMRYRLISLIVRVCRYKARQRYRRS